MKKVFLWLLIVSMIAVFSLAGCKTESSEEVVGEQAVAEEAEEEEVAIDISPDGSKIAFVSGSDENNEIYVMDSDGKN